MWTENFQMFKLALEKAEEQEIKLPTPSGSSKKQESSRKNIYFCILTMPKPLTMCITINCGNFWKRWEYQTTWPASWEIFMQVRKQQLELCMGGRRQDGGGIGRGDHFLPYKFIERTIECRANFTKQLLIAIWGHQAPRKAAHCLWKDVGRNIKDKKRDKRAKDGDLPREESLNRGSFQIPGNPHTGGSGGSFWILEGNLTGRERINKTHRLCA